MAKAFKKNGSMLKRVIILPFFIILLAAFAVFWLVYLSGSREAVRYAVQSVVREVSDRVTTETLSRLETARRAAASNASLFAVAATGIEGSGSIRALFLSQLSLYPNVAIFAVGLADGEYWEAQRTADGGFRVGRAGTATGGALESRTVGPDGQFGPVDLRRPGYDPRQRPWYLAAAGSADYGWTSTYTLYSNEDPAMAAAVPIRGQDGTLLGATVATLTLGSLSTELARYRETARGLIFVVDEKGFLVASSFGNKAIAGPEGRYLATAHPDTVLASAALAAGLQLSPSSAPVPDVPEDFGFALGSERYLGRRISYRDGRGLGWTVVTALRESAFTDRLGETDRRTLAILGIFLGLSFATGWMVVSYVTKPLRILVEGADSLQPGRDIPPALVAITAKPNELGRLARSFVAMKGRLDETFGELEKGLGEKEVLLKEVHHRVKNNLQIVSSILSLQSDALTDQDTRVAFEECQERIQAMALVHEEVYQTGSFVELDMSGYLARICDTLRIGKAACRMDIVSRVPEGSMMPLDRAIPCGLVVNELVTNAIKHAFPRATCGQISVSMRKNSADWILSVEDDGIGYSAEDPDRDDRGIGGILVEGLVSQTGGTLVRERSASGGTLVTVCVPF